MKTIKLTVNEVAIVKNAIATTVRTAKSDLRGSDVITKKLFDETFMALESLSERAVTEFTVTPFEGNILATVITVTVASLKADCRGANIITKRMLGEQITGLENVLKQINPQVELPKAPEVEVKSAPEAEIKPEKKAASEDKPRKRRTKKVPVAETIETLE